MRQTRRPTPSKPRPAPKLPRGKKAHGDELNQATIDEFDQEGLGVAPKE